MTLAHLNCSEVSAIDTFNKNTVLRFENRIKCLNSVFWNLHQTVENNEKAMLVIDQKEDLEYINYFLSKYMLKPLSIIINPSQEYISQPILAKLNDQLELDASREGHKDLRPDIDFLAKTILKHLKDLREPKLGKLNILEIFERRKVTPLKQKNLDVDFYQLVPFSDFKSKKSLIIKAIEMFKPEFRFIDQNNILKDAFILNMSIPDIKSVLSDIQEELNLLSDALNKIKSQVEKEITQTHLKKTNEMHRYFFEISKFKNSQSLTDTDLKKINHLADKFDLKANAKTSHLELEERIIKIEQIYRKHIENLANEKKKFSQYTLQRINKFNGGDKAVEIFKRIDLIFKKIAKTHAFKDLTIQKPCSLLACSQICDALINKVDFAEHFMDNSKAYINWLYFKNSLKVEDRTIIDALSKVKSDWVEVFESNYIDGFLSSEIVNLFDIESSFDELNNKLEDYKTQVAIQIQNNYRAAADNKIIPNAAGDQTKIAWKDFLVEFGRQTTQKFPIVILDSKSYVKHSAALESIIDKTIFLNNSPKAVPTKDGKRNVFAGYTNEFVREVVAQTKKYEDVEVKNFRGVGFNVNRFIKHLNNSERNMLALYLGQSIHKLNSSYRIFQLKSKSIVSFLKDDKNAQLLQSLSGYGAKEIFSQEENNNLLPGIIADPNTEPVILVEDNMMVLDQERFNFEQLLVLGNIKDAGIKIISVNNFKLLTHKNYSLDRLISNLLRNDDLVQTKVKA